jgi:ribose-phosphate pyrophosphokinase
MKKENQNQSKPLILIMPSAPTQTAKAAQEAGIDTLPASIGLFASGEPFAELFPKSGDAFDKNAAALKGRDVIVVQSGGEPVGETTAHLLMAIHTLKAHGAARVTAVMPFAPYMRQDRSFDKRFVSLGASFFAAQLKAAGADAAVTLTPHSQAGIKAYKDVFGDDFTAVQATDLFAEHIRARFGSDPTQIAIGAPDGADKAADEGQARARALADSVFGSHDGDKLFLIAKTHTGVNDTKIVAFTGDVAGKHCVIVDDMIDGGSTMINAASLLKARGAASVTACAAHGILSGGALEKILSARPDGQHFAIDTLVLSDSLPSTTQKAAALAQKDPALAARIDILPAGAGLIAAAQALGQKNQTHAAPAALRKPAR